MAAACTRAVTHVSRAYKPDGPAPLGRARRCSASANDSARRHALSPLPSAVCADRQRCPLQSLWRRPGERRSKLWQLKARTDGRPARGGFRAAVAEPQKETRWTACITMFGGVVPCDRRSRGRDDARAGDPRPTGRGARGRSRVLQRLPRRRGRPDRRRDPGLQRGADRRERSFAESRARSAARPSR